jgi:pilus assembly protein CpaB
MGAARLLIVLAIAAVAALALALLVRSISAGHKPPAAAPIAQVVQQPMTRVLVAKQDLKIADRIGPDNVAWEAWPTGSINAVYITGGIVPQQNNLAVQATTALVNVQKDDSALQSVAGSLVREPITKNEPITANKLVRGDGSFMAVKLPAGMRAMSVPITAESDAGGFVLPGDHVDVMLSVKGQPGATDQSHLATSHLVMRNVLVLAVDQNTNTKPEQASMVGATATLEISAADVDSLSRSQTQGDLVLILRSYADANGPSGRVGPAAADQGVVRVYRSGQITEVRVAR